MRNNIKVEYKFYNKTLELFKWPTHVSCKPEAMDFIQSKDQITAKIIKVIHTSIDGEAGLILEIA
jgi:hypothetical protein